MIFDCIEFAIGMNDNSSNRNKWFLLFISGLLPTEWVKTGGFCELLPILKGFSLTWRSLANGMLGDAKINQDKTPAGWLPLPRIPPRSHRYGCFW
jgi:hypothetical protein